MLVLVCCPAGTGIAQEVKRFWHGPGQLAEESGGERAGLHTRELLMYELNEVVRCRVNCSTCVLIRQDRLGGGGVSGRGWRIMGH